MSKGKWVIVSLIILLAIGLRFYRITLNPPGLHIDEVAIGYNAYSILKTGKDEWGVPTPLLFRSFDDYKGALLIYAVAVAERFLEPSELAVRLPSVLAGIGSVVVLYLLTCEFLLLSPFRDKSYRIPLGFIAAFLLATSMWHLQFSRIAFEGALGLFWTLLGVWLFLLAARKNIWLLFLSVTFFTAATLTHHSERVFAPVFVFFLFVIFYQKLWENRFKVLLIIIFGFIINLPYLSSYFSPEGRMRLSSEGIFGRSESAAVLFVNNLVSNFSPDYLFFHGDQNGRHSVKKLGELYLWQFPFMVAGLLYLLKKRDRLSLIIFFWLLMAAIPVALTQPAPHASRNIIAVPVWELICALGIAVTYRGLKTRQKYLVTAALSLIVFLSQVIYLDHYYFRAPKEYALDWYDGNKETVRYLKDKSLTYDKVFISRTPEPIFFLFYLPVDPQVLQNSGHDLKNLGKFHYVESITTEKVKTDGRDLVVTPPLGNFSG